MTTLVSPADDAVRVCGPGCGPRIHAVTVAIPDASVTIAVDGMTSPPSLAENVTEAPATGAPFSSVTLTDGAIGTLLPAAPCCASPATTVSRAGTSGAATLNGELVIGATFPLEATSVYPLPTLSTLRSLNVATPFDALRDSVPLSAPPLGLLPSEIVTGLAAVVWFPLASTSVTLTADNVAPAVPFPGCAENIAAATIPGCAVATNVTWRPLAIDAVADDCPVRVPSVRTTDDCPFASVEDVAATVPFVATQLMLAPLTGAPTSSATCTTNGAASGVPTRPV